MSEATLDHAPGFGRTDDLAAPMALMAAARQHRLRRARRSGLLRHGFLVCLCLVTVYPLLWMVAASLLPDQQILASVSPFPTQFRWQNYTQGWSALSFSFSTFYFNSICISSLSVVGSVFASSLVAFAFARLDFPGRRILFGLMLFTLMIPQHVTLIPQYVLFLNLGWVDTILPLVVPKFMAVDAFFIFLMVQFFRTIPREVEEAARMDGAGPWRIYRKIIIPLSTPVLATAAIFSFIWTWDDFFGPLIYLSQPETFNVPLALRAFAGTTEQTSWGELFAMSTLSLVPVFIVFVLCQRLVIDGAAGLRMRR
jgi:multiple sugar transport system permease protein